MLIEKRFQENENYALLEFHNVNKETIPWLECLAGEYHCKVEKKEWRSKYNNYVVYDYEPFCSEGFEITVTLSKNVSPLFENHSLKSSKGGFLNCLYLILF